MPDGDGYPTDEELETIEKWDPRDQKGFFEFIREIWWQQPNPYGWRESWEKDTIGEYREISMSTGGWSGNESIIHHMRANRWMWDSAWLFEGRGGHFTFGLRCINA